MCPLGEKSIQIFLSISVFLALLDVHCCMGFPLVVTSRGYFTVVVNRLFFAVVPLVVEHGLWGVSA